MKIEARKQQRKGKAWRRHCEAIKARREAEHTAKLQASRPRGKATNPLLFNV